MSNLIVKEINTETNEIIERPMTEQEQNHYLANVELAQLEEEKIKTRTIQRATAQAKLAALGLTVEDLTALGL